jgi:tRNA pseudouridine38-40 synthase
VPRYKLTIAYDGTDYCGWQRQEPPVPDARSTRPADHTPPAPHPSKVASAVPLPPREGDDRPRVALRTIQHVLEVALAEVVREPVVVMGASRTDAGVHARGQVAAFTCGGDEAGQAESADRGWPVSRGPDRLARALNGRLPDDVMVLSAEPAAHDFDPIRGAIRKAYSYTLHVTGPGGTRPLWDRRYVHPVWEALEVERMQRAADALVGEHDFAAFAAAGHGRLSTVRTVYSCRVSELEGDWSGARRVRIEIEGNGFLWNMVRIIAGTLVEAGRGRLEPGDVPGILESRDRTRAGPTLPPTGLCLEWVKYG